MKKSTQIFIMLFLMLSCLTGCKEADLGDTYAEGNDCQYMFHDMGVYDLYQAKGENGTFFLLGHYIYYLDDESQTMVPLCNKADCLHTCEVEAERYAECNAYIENPQDAGIAYCNGYLYYIVPDFKETKLYRMKEDGSGKEVIYQWDGRIVEGWCIHRDVLYYVEHIYAQEKDAQGVIQSTEQYTVKGLSLTGLNRMQPKTIFKPEDDLMIYTVANLLAYGNHLYFQIHGATTQNTEIITDENYLDYTYFKYFTYDIQTGEISELTIPEMENGLYLQSITFWNDKLILQPYDFKQDQYGTVDVYLADLDGSNVELFLKDRTQWTYYRADGRYLYITNEPLVLQNYEEKIYWQVYDSDMQYVDTIEMPYFQQTIGSAEGMYIYFNREEEADFGLLYFDKNTIGSYDGAMADYSVIVELPYPKVDELQEGQ